MPLKTAHSTDLPLPEPPAPLLPTQAYHALLIRYWREEEGGQWRFLVQDVRTGEQYAFAEMDLLLAFLSQQVDGKNLP